MGMSFGTNPNDRGVLLCINSLKMKALTRLAVSLLLIGVIARSAVNADEFDPFLIYSEALPLNDKWEACGASFVRDRLQSQKAPDVLAKEALANCRAQEERLRLFFVRKIGRKSAENVIALLREKYRSGLSAAIEELRTRD
jgi:hypothetical protein